MLAGALAIAGVPGLSGFFSKDEILWRTWEAGHPLLWAAGAATALLTAFYMFRLIYLAFHGTFRGTSEQERARKQQPRRVPRWLNQIAAVKEARRTEHERRGPHRRSRQTNRPAGSNRTRRRAEKGLNPRHRERRRHGEREQAKDRARPRHRQRRDCSAGTSAGRVNTPLVGTQPSAMSQ